MSEQSKSSTWKKIIKCYATLESITLSLPSITRQVETVLQRTFLIMLKALLLNIQLFLDDTWVNIVFISPKYPKS